MSFFSVVAGLFFLSICLAVLSVAVYIHVKKRFQVMVDDDYSRTHFGDPLSGNELNIEQVIRSDWLKIVTGQQSLCDLLIAQKQDVAGNSDESLLLCWKAFLDIEYEVLNKGISFLDIEPYLDVFQDLVDKVDKALDIEALQKSLQSLKDTLEHVNQENRCTSDEMLQIKEKGILLKRKFNELNALRKQDTSLERELLNVRSEIARIVSIQTKVKQRISLIHGSQFIEKNASLLQWMQSITRSDLLVHMEDELVNTVSELQRISNEQLKTIQALQKENKHVKGEEINQKIQLSNDVLIVRLENVFSDKNRSVKSLENKLTSLQMVRYNLNVDLLKAEEILHVKDKVLKENIDSMRVIAEMKALIESKHKTMQSMQDLLHSSPLTVESDAYSHAQGERLNELRVMVSESELYVEMLERDLVDAKKEHERLYNLLAEKTDDFSDQPIEAKQRYLESREVHQTLEAEWQQVKESLEENVSIINKVKWMCSETDVMKKKADSVTEKYTQLEEKYLALIAL